MRHIKINNGKNQTNLYTYDITSDLRAEAQEKGIAFDTEAMGLIYKRDRLCTVQMSLGDGTVHLVHFPTPNFQDSPNLCALLRDKNIVKIAHYARFDIGIIQHTWGIRLENVYCTKIASRLCRTFTDKHGLKDLCKDLLNIELNKETRASDWGDANLSDEQVHYASSDVLYLHKLKSILDGLLERENRTHILKAYCDFLPYRAELDTIAGDTFDPINYHMYRGS